MPACNRAISGALGGLGLKKDAATVAGFGVVWHCHHEHENARDKIR
ncbi:hypothetical protein KZX18_06165 [Micrococcus luteus]|nr:hypothetical protein [Micrococcus luteus]MCK6109547.1 hypothetical protein [Micrococcus luteus]